MSDTLRTDQEQQADQEHQADVETEEVDTLGSRPLFEDEEDETELIAPPHRTRHLWWIVASVALVVIVIGAGTFIYTQRAQASQVQYRTIAVTAGNLTTQVSASGPLQAQAEYDMNFSTAGQIKEIDVHVGQTVKSGTVLAKLNAPALGIAVQQAQLTVNNAQETYDTAVTNGDAQTTIDADNNALQNAKLQLQTARNNLAAGTLTAPANATVAAINGVVGQTVSGSGGGSSNSSSSSTSAFIVLLNTSGYTITASVNEADIANVQLNQPARFTLTAFPSQTFRATVSNISQISTTTSGVVSYPITLTVDMSSVGKAHLYPGMTATANITTAQRIGAELVSNSAFTFPTTALQAGVITRSDLTQLAGGIGTRGSVTGQSGTGTTSASSRRIVLVQRGGKLVPVAVTVGLTNGTFSEVLSGLNDGDLVVVSATGGPFANLSTTTSGTTGGTGRGGLGGGGFGRGGFGGGGGAGGGNRTGLGG